jgi:dihydroneopterin aldolase
MLATGSEFRTRAPGFSVNRGNAGHESHVSRRRKPLLLFGTKSTGIAAARSHATKNLGVSMLAGHDVRLPGISAPPHRENLKLRPGHHPMTPLHLPTDYIRILVRCATVEVRVGLHPWERHPERPSRLEVSVDLFVALPPGPTLGGGMVDYDRVRDFIRGLQSRPHTDLLETIVEEIVAFCFQDTRVLACRVEAVKPDIFNEAEGAGIEVFRTREGWSGG